MRPQEPTPSRMVANIVRRSFPYPIASAWHRVALATADAERIRQLTAFQEVLLRTLAALLLPDYLRGDPASRIEDVIPRLGRASLGTWVELVRETVRTLERRASPPVFMPEALPWYFDARGKPSAAAQQLDQLVRLRNRASHDAPVTGAGEIASQTRELFERSLALLDSLTWLARYRLLRVLTQDPQRSGGTRGKVQYFAGSEALAEPVTVKWRSQLLPQVVYLAKPSGDELLEVSPFLQVMTDPGTRQDRLFLFKGHHKGGKLVLAHDDTGHDGVERWGRGDAGLGSPHGRPSPWPGSSRRRMDMTRHVHTKPYDTAARPAPPGLVD